jgi:peptide deformylase
MIRKIITNPLMLKKKSKDVSSEEVQDIIKELENNLDTSKGIGLSAMQIGILKKVAIIRIPQFSESLDLINARILEKNERFRFKQEGCLSLPGIYVDTIRYKEILIENNEIRFLVTMKMDGLLCLAIQHEIDHFNGITILDRKWRKKR